MNFAKKSLELHKKLHGKIEVTPKFKINTASKLATAYTPGVAEPCRVIAKNPKESFDLTCRGNLVAVVTDGSAVLGLGNIGASAGMPVMEGKCILFKEFANVDAVPICLKTQDPKEIINIIKNLEPTFGGINIEDISSPRCFEIEETLKKELSIPVMHDDQHGTAIVVAAALTNAINVVKKQ
jgi:malate dehydrogenase (oxaloacetate-decarboxylating)